jgi:uncharacterized membrane protein
MHPRAAMRGRVSQQPALVAFAHRLEEVRGLEALGEVLEPVARTLVAEPRRRAVLQGEWLGHAAHPMLTDLPIGFWTCAGVLDLVGGRRAAPAADLLLSLGLLSAAPTALTGLAEWAETGGGVRRVGALHGVSNTVAVGLYGASWLARRRGRRTRGVLMALGGATAATFGGYLGGHLVSARKVSTRHRSFAG